MAGKAAQGATDAEALARRASLFAAVTLSAFAALMARGEAINSMQAATVVSMHARRRFSNHAAFCFARICEQRKQGELRLESRT